MSIQEVAAFSVSNSDIGNVTSTSMDIKLHNNTPVQLNYHSVPKPLYAELKTHIEDLLNRGWIVSSGSSYSSPVVSFRKKDGTLRLPCDNRKLNSNTIPDRHPLPKVQQILENLGGNQYFSILDQGKAYQHKNEANKTKDPADIRNHKKQRNCVVKLNKNAKLEYFRNMNLITVNHFG